MMYGIDLTNILQYGLPIVVSLITGVAGWFAGKKKNAAEIEKLKTEIDAGELKNIETALSIYREMVEDLNKQVAEYKSQARELQRQNAALLMAMDKADKENHKLMKQIEALQHTLKEYTNNK